jgi:hypothetical protein
MYNEAFKEIDAHLYGASALAAAANSGSHLSPFASNFSAELLVLVRFGYYV